MVTTETDLLGDLEREAAEAPPAAPSPDSLLRLTAMADELRQVRSRVERGERLLAELKSRDWELRTRLLPDLMDELGVPSIVVGETSLRVTTHFHASIPEENREQAHDWLDARGHGDLVSRQLVVSFPAGFEEEARRLEAHARTSYQMATTEQRRAVPWARLTSWFKEYSTRSRSPSEPAPEPLPLALLGASAERRVEIDGERSRRR